MLDIRGIRGGVRRGVVLLSAGVAVLGVVTVSAVPAGAASFGGNYTAITPYRLVDTRQGGGPVKALSTLTLTVAGAHGVPAASGVSAVALNVTVTAPTSSGFLTVWPGGTLPNVSNVNFTPGQTNANLVTVPISSTGRISIYNGSSGTAQVIVDVSGYYSSGSPQSAGEFSPVTPTRILDTRSGPPPIKGKAGSAVPAGGAIRVQITGVAGLPDTDVGAVLINLTATAPAGAGYLEAWADGTTQPQASNVNFTRGQTRANLAEVPVDADGQIDIANESSGPVHVVADVFGYLTEGGPLVAGATGPVPSGRLLDTRIRPAQPVPGLGSLKVQVLGRQWAPPSGLAAAALNVTVITPAAPGFVAAWAGGAGAPPVSNVNFTPGQTVANLVMAPLAPDGTVTIYNGSPKAVNVAVDLNGYVLSADRPAPPVASTSHYVRNISGVSSDASTMNAEGCADAQANSGAGSYVTLLDIGAQSVTSPPLSATNPGVALSGFPDSDPRRLTYAQLVTALEGYLDGYVSCRTGESTITVGVSTSNDGAFTPGQPNYYAPADRGADWANQVVNPLRAHVAADSWLSVVGADDIEAGFASTEAQAVTWEQNYLANTTAPLIFNGSTDGCPTDYANRTTGCGGGWTLAQYYSMAHGLAPTRILVLPQIYTAGQAFQWANVDLYGATSTDQLQFIGVLTEHAAVPGQYTPAQGWGALTDALWATPRTTPATAPLLTDLRSDAS